MGGYGGRFAQWVHSDNPQPYNSFGNGSAMRVSPVAWACRNSGQSELLEMAGQTAACSHDHPEGIKGAQTVALAVSHAIALTAGNHKPAQDEVRRMVEECARFGNYDVSVRRESVINRFDETCQDTVPVALWVIGESTSFEDAVRKAVSLGADADTLGAIVGGIAEAVWGIPADKRSQAMDVLPEEMKRVVNRFYETYINDGGAVK